MLFPTFVVQLYAVHPIFRSTQLQQIIRNLECSVDLSCRSV